VFCVCILYNVSNELIGLSFVGRQWSYQLTDTTQHIDSLCLNADWVDIDSRRSICCMANIHSSWVVVVILWMDLCYVHSRQQTNSWCCCCWWGETIDYSIRSVCRYVSLITNCCSVCQSKILFIRRKYQWVTLERWQTEIMLQLLLLWIITFH
jgi:hypothetical protein